jgi:SagB-type dehydrogenase family enzyme
MTAMLETAYTERLRLVSNVYSTVADDGELRLLVGGRSQSFGRVGDWQPAVLRRLAAGDCALPELTAVAGAQGTAVSAVADFVAALAAGGWLASSVYLADRALYTLRPVRPSVPEPPEPVGPVVLSRFAVVHREADQLVVESPLAWARIELRDPAACALVTTLARPLPAASVPDHLPPDATRRMLRDLYAAGLTVPSPGAEDVEPRLRQWRPHELWFHGRTRMSDDRYIGSGYGRTQWGKDLLPPVPARREPYPGPAVDLARPDLARLRAADISLTAAIEDRASVRRHDDDRPITVDQLGEFLYRCGRVRQSTEVDGVEYVSRPYPSGGAAYELELYPVVRLVRGLARGLYHYDGHEHRLRTVRGRDPDVARLLLVAAARSAVGKYPPHVLIVISARFGRLMLTYEEMAYSLILKHVGVLYQTMYLVATSMGLGACALGGGDAAAFNAATGTDYLVESGVGEFALGSVHRDDRQGRDDGVAALRLPLRAHT